MSERGQLCSSDDNGYHNSGDLRRDGCGDLLEGESKNQPHGKGFPDSYRGSYEESRGHRETGHIHKQEARFHRDQYSGNSQAAQDETAEKYLRGSVI